MSTPSAAPSPTAGDTITQSRGECTGEGHVLRTMMNGPQRPLAGLAGLTFLLVVTFLSTSRYEMSATITEGIAILFVAVLLYLGYVAVRCRMSPPVLSEDGSVTDP